jgi:hypothetical protein
MRIKTVSVAITIIVVIFGGIVIASAAGFWNTKNSKEPRRFSEGKFVGTYDPSDIRGSYSFGEISSLFDVPLEDMAYAFGIEKLKDPADFECRELEAIYAELKINGTEIGTASVRLFVAFYTGLPFEPEAGTYLPAQAYDVLNSKALDITQERLDYLKEIVIEVPVSEQNTVEHSEEKSNTDYFVKGSTTFRDLILQGLEKDEMESLIGEEISDIDQKIKDFCDTNDITFGPVKQMLEEKLNS